MVTVTMLDRYSKYDDCAFSYFAAYLIGIYLVPVTTTVLIRQIFRHIIPGRGGTKSARTEAEKAKCERLKKDKRWSCGMKLLTLIPVWVCFFYLTYSMTDDGEIKGFDPYTVLGVTPSTGPRDVKKRYRELSLMYHPDKNPDNKAAELMFKKVYISYEAITDPGIGAICTKSTA